MNKMRPFISEKVRADGFTLVELLVVIATIGVLTMMLLPALASTHPNSQAFQCLENLRRLTLGWQMYAEDNNSKLPPNGEFGEQPSSWPNPVYQSGGQYAQWCPGNITIPATISLQTNFIQSGLIYPYVKILSFYRCPADNSFVRFGSVILGYRPRSYSMNCWLSPFPGKDAYSIFGGSKARIFIKDTDITRPKPSMTFVFMEENVSSIDDGYFAGSPGLPNYWINIPTARHGNTGGLSYADGHSEMKGWTDKNVLSPPTFNSSSFAGDPNSGDNAWLEQRESSLLQ